MSYIGIIHINSDSDTGTISDNYFNSTSPLSTPIEGNLWFTNLFKQINNLNLSNYDN